jgi:integrase
VLSKMFAWLIRDRRVTANPCASVARPEIPGSRDRVLTNSEIGDFWKAADSIDNPFATVLKLLLLTGCRLREVAEMRRDELSEDGGTWNLPGARTKNKKPHGVPLPPLARDILASVKRIEGCPYVFSTTGKSPVQGWSKIKDRVDAAMKPASPWVLHDLRRTAATGMAELGIAPHIVEAVLNHVSGARAGVAGTYNRAAYAPEKKAALERWGDHVDALVSGRKANVVTLREATS